MKAIKLIMTFVVLLAIVVSAFYVSSGSGRNTDLPEPPDETLKEMRTQIEQDWAQKGDWDEKLFAIHCDKLNQMKKEYSVGILVDMNTRLAVETIYKKLIDEWSSPSCRKSVVDGYIKALDTVCRADGNAQANNNVKKLRSINKVYRTALSVAHISIGLTHGFDGSSWRSFSNYSNAVKARKASVVSNAMYKEYLSNISDIKNGLASIDGRLQNARTAFYQSLSRAIISHYSDIPSSERNNTQLSSLRNARNRYNNEYRSNDALNSFVSTFYRDVRNNDN